MDKETKEQILNTITGLLNLNCIEEKSETWNFAETLIKTIDESFPVEKRVSPTEPTQDEKLVLNHIKLPLTIDQISRYMFDANGHMIAETRGWGWIQYKQQAELIQDTLGEMFIKSFNQVYGKQ